MPSSPMPKAPSLPTGSPWPLSPRPVYLSRVWRCAWGAILMMAGTLAIGTLGYHFIAGFDWLDAFHQSSLLLSGMGPVKDLTTPAGKLFDSVYALVCALVMLGAAGFLFAPIIHRVLHRYHLEDARGDR